MKTISSPFDKFAITKLQPYNHIAEWLSIVHQRIHSSSASAQRNGTLSSEFLLDMAQVGETVLLCFSVENERVPQCRTSLIDVKFGHHALQNLPHLCEQLRQNLLQNLELFLATNVMGGGAMDEQIRNEVGAGNVLHCRVSTRVNGRTFLEGYSSPWGQPPSPFSSNWVDRMNRGYYGAHPLQCPAYAHNAFHSPGAIPPEYRAADVQYPAADEQPVATSQHREEAVGEAGPDGSYRQEFDAYDFETLNQKFLELLVEKTPDYLKADWGKKAYEFKAVLFGGEISLCWTVFHLGDWRILLSAKENMVDWLEDTALESAVALADKSWLEVDKPTQEWPTTDCVELAERSVQVCDAKKTIRRTGVFNSDAAG